MSTLIELEAACNRLIKENDQLKSKVKVARVALQRVLTYATTDTISFGEFAEEIVPQVERAITDME